MKKRTVRLQNAVLGEGMPKVCVPVMGESPEALAEMTDAARAEADIIELRLDSATPTLDAEKARCACKTVRERAGNVPILATMRTARDGGAGDADAARYEALLALLVKERLCDALDVELSVGEEAFARIVGKAHAAGVPVVGSFHDFEKTPKKDEMAARLQRMAALGADVCKIAVMPRSRKDVVALTAACAQADDELPQPIIAIAMGELGASTRICAEAMGSCLSFGTAGRASAPGQTEAGELRRAMESVHTALTGGGHA